MGNSGSCTVAVGTMTFAFKGQHLLGENGIASQIVRLHPSQTRHGCAYGIGLDCRELKRAILLLTEGGIRYSEVIESGGGSR